MANITSNNVAEKPKSAPIRVSRPENIESLSYCWIDLVLYFLRCSVYIAIFLKSRTNFGNRKNSSETCET